MFLWGEKCDFQAKNRYYKNKASGLNVVEHHRKFDCTGVETENDEQEKEIKTRLAKWEQLPFCEIQGVQAILFLGSRTIELHFKNLFTGWRNLWMYSDNTVKEEAKQARKVCPYGCEKSWKNIYTLSVKRHILFKCPKIDGQTKVAEFFKKKKRLSISDVVFWIFRLGMGLNQIVISWLFWLCFFSQVIFFVVWIAEWTVSFS